MTEEDLSRVIASIPILQGFSLEDFAITVLPGYTNRNYRLYNQHFDWVLRIQKPATNCFIDRDIEAHNQALAQQLGLAPRVAWRDATGISLTPTLGASRTLRVADFAVGDIVQLCVGSLQRLHRSGLQFHGRVDLGALLQKHFELLHESDRPRYRERLSRAQDLLVRLDDSDQGYVASHNDLVLGNLLLERSHLCIIDWEYSAMASPYWDLATLCNAAEFDRQQSRRLLRAYCVGGAAMKESTLFDYRDLLKLLSDCWMVALA
ncbi:MAG: phosphotransferase family protein [Gammaproteobacteria bacterium]|nr:phosphotransferase family protein [Gammaproteobacteria bacterium]